MKTLHTTIAVFSSVLLGACATVGPDYQAQDPATTLSNTEFHELRTAAGLSGENVESLANWWESLNDATLNTLISSAVNGNLDLRIAQSRLVQARAARGISASARQPSVAGSASAQRIGSSENSSTGSESGVFSTGFDASWELDLFGGIRRSVEAADADVQVSEESLRDTLVSVLAEVALNYVELRSAEARLLIAEENLASQNVTFDLISSQQKAGLVEELDMQRARSNVESTRAQLPSLATSVEQARNRISTLLGKPAGSLDSMLANSQAVPTPPVQVAIGIPADMLRRRPDVRAAERQLAAETARIGVATAELYPKLSLTGSIGLESLSASQLFESASSTFGLGSIVNWRLFEGGKIRQQIAVQTAVQQQAAIAWESAILAATEEVENALTAYANEQLRHYSLQQAAQAAARAAELARSRYDAGLSTFLDVLDADRSRLTAEDSLALSNALITTNLIRLYKALGGGWESLLPSNSVTEGIEGSGVTAAHRTNV